MLYLPEPSKQTLKEYFEKIKPKVTGKINALSDANVRAYLNLNLKDILTDKPKDLLSHQTDLIDNLFKAHILNFIDAEYKQLLCVWTKKHKSTAEISLCTKYKIAIDVFNCFDYENFISQSKSTAYQLALALNRNTCTYCNRLYTNTIVVQKNDKGRITRPQFDHWFAKSKFPILALSFYNLIPSCSTCNSSIKGDTEFDLSTHIHPYIKEKGQDFSFSYEIENIDSYKVKIENVATGSKIENTLKEFKIEEVYNAHSMFELKDLIDLKQKYSEDYLDLLFKKSFKGIGMSEEEIYRMVFGVEKEEKDFHKRPFSKFKTDIVKELRKND